MSCFKKNSRQIAIAKRRKVCARDRENTCTPDLGTSYLATVLPCSNVSCQPLPELVVRAFRNCTDLSLHLARARSPPHLWVRYSVSSSALTGWAAPPPPSDCAVLIFATATSLRIRGDEQHRRRVCVTGEIGSFRATLRDAPERVSAKRPSFL